MQEVWEGWDMGVLFSKGPKAKIGLLVCDFLVARDPPLTVGLGSGPCARPVGMQECI